MTPTQGRPHLAASFLALAIAAAALWAGLGWCKKVEERHIADLGTDLSDSKLHGIALQREAFERDDLLPLYGSSELVKQVPAAAAEFFHDYPTGFRVFPVGKEGTSQIAVAQKLASLGQSIEGKKVALSISPSFFFADRLDPEWYRGNFSALQATELAFSSELSFSLKRDLSRRLLAYPDTLRSEWLLDTVLHRIARGTMLDRALYYAALPLGRVQAAIGRAQDHFESALYITSLEDFPAQARKPRVLNWAEHLRKADALARQIAAKTHAPKLTKRPRGSDDATFLARLNRATEWTDFELTLRVIRELGAEPLLLSMPIHARDLETVGVSSKARERFPQQLERVAGRHSAPLVYFKAHEEDPLFFADHLDHLSPLGWAFYNETLDDFYHERDLKL